MKPVTLARSVVQRARDCVALVLGQSLHRRALREVLANEAVGVLVRAPLPRGVRGSEVDLHAGCTLDGLVAVKLGAIVDRDGDEQTRVRLNQFDHTFVQGSDGATGEFADQRGTGSPLYQGHDAVIAA